MLTFRNTQSGWVVFGPAAELKPGRVTVARVSKPYNVDGVPHVYGYLAAPVAAGCECGSECPLCRGGCRCDRHCVCQGGNVYDC